MVLTMTLPDQYGFVLLCTLVGHFVTSLVLSGKVMAARDAFDVPYPNLYGTPGFHKQADDFNRVQRGHQSMYETSPSVILFCLFGGLQYVLV
jgi:glutathione S-transferase